MADGQTLYKDFVYTESTYEYYDISSWAQDDIDEYVSSSENQAVFASVWDYTEEADEDEWTRCWYADFYVFRNGVALHLQFDYRHHVGEMDAEAISGELDSIHGRPSARLYGLLDHIISDSSASSRTPWLTPGQHSPTSMPPC